MEDMSDYMIKRTVAEMKMYILDHFELMMSKGLEQEEETLTEEMEYAYNTQEILVAAWKNELISNFREDRHDASEEKIFQLKLRIRDIKPMIWRKIQVPSDSSFEELHNVIQMLFDWEDMHVHEFEVKDSEGDNILINELDIEEAPDESEKDERLEFLDGYLSMKNRHCEYTYDFGDQWRVAIELEKISSPEEGVSCPNIVKGKRAGPPEDCGGIPGYYGILEALKNPEENEDIVDWLEDEGFDPNYFNKDMDLDLAIRPRGKTHQILFDEIMDTLEH